MESLQARNVVMLMGIDVTDEILLYHSYEVGGDRYHRRNIVMLHV